MFVFGGNNGGIKDDYKITNSLRFRSSASAYLNRTPASATNRRTWTWSGWVKLGSNIGTARNFAWFEGTTSSTVFSLIGMTDNNADCINYVDYSSGRVTNIITTQVFRDPSAWYHVVVAYDSTQATSSDRVKIYVNGSQITSFSTATYPALNYQSNINTNAIHSIGFDYYSGAATKYFDGYITEYNFIDGQALTPSSFGYTHPKTGVWRPKPYTGTYGTNGFYLKFSDIATTSGSNAGLGKDFSGNTNYWTTNNISVTSGTTYDAMTDVPTLTSSTASNYATLNPLQSYAAPTEANLKFTSGAAWTTAASTYYISSGKWYWEATFVSGSFLLLGISAPASFPTVLSTYTGATSTSYAYSSAAAKWNNNAQTSYGATFTTNDVIGVALDMDAGTLTFYKNGTSQGTAYTGLTGEFTPTFSPYSMTVAINFGQRAFSYTPPTGYKALNTYNLPKVIIAQGNKVMDATTYTGTGATQNVTNSGSMQPDIIWIKSRSGATNHTVYDSVRGLNASPGSPGLFTNLTNAESISTNTVSAALSNGFTISGTASTLNTNGATYVGWQWQAGKGTTSSNTDGSITSTVSVNASAGFSVCTFTTHASGTGTFGHGLGVAPKMVILKPRTSVSNWSVYNENIGNTKYMQLNTTIAAATSTNAWNNTSPTSTVFTLGVNWAGAFTVVAYCWAEIAGFSKFDSYTGNGSTDGPFVYTGFRPKWVIIKSSTNGTTSWQIYDSNRNSYNVANNVLFSNLSDAEVSSSVVNVDFLSNGFKCRGTNTNINSNGATYIYAAFAENPFKYSNAR